MFNEIFVLQLTEDEILGALLDSDLEDFTVMIFEMLLGSYLARTVNLQMMKVMTVTKGMAKVLRNHQMKTAIAAKFGGKDHFK